jgi:hypothetical protein
MARSKKSSAPFFLRKQQISNGTTFAESNIDVSSFVDVLEGEVLRVNKVYWEWTSDNSGPILGADLGASKGCSADAQLTTKTTATRQNLVDNSVICKNILYAHTDSNTDITMIKTQDGMNPMDFESGFMVATDTIYLGVIESADTFTNPVRVNTVLECEVVKLNLSEAQAVLVSQSTG